MSMQSPFITLVLLLQIMAQSLSGSTGTLELCIPLGDCCEHRDDPPPLAALTQPEADCHCHLRVPLPGGPKILVRDPSRVEALHRAFATPSVIDIPAGSEPHPVMALRARERPPDCGGSARCMVLRVTHLRL